MTRTRLGSVLALAVLAAGYWLLTGHETAAQVEPIPIQTPGAAKGELRPYMHAKLYHTQQVMGGLVTHDFAEIRKGAGALKQTSLDAPQPKGNDKTDDELYEHFKLEFLRLTTQLGQMADDENLEGAAFVYQSLTANCMACHEFLSQSSGQ